MALLKKNKTGQQGKPKPGRFTAKKVNSKLGKDGEENPSNQNQTSKVDLLNKPLEEEPLIPFSNEFKDKIKSEYSKFYASPKKVKDDYFDAFFKEVKNKFEYPREVDAAPGWRYKKTGTLIEGEDMPEDFKRLIKKGKATEEDFEFVKDRKEIQIKGTNVASEAVRMARNAFLNEGWIRKKSK